MNVAVFYTDYLLGNKLAEIVGRTHSVYNVESSGKARNGCILNLEDEEDICSYLRINRISTICLSSIPKQKPEGAILKNIINSANTMGVKVIFINRKNCVGFNDGFVTNHLVTRIQTNLLVEIDDVYGCFDSNSTKGILLSDQNKVNSAKNIDILADELALWIVKHFNDYGHIIISNDAFVESTTYFPVDLYEGDVRFNKHKIGEKVVEKQKSCVFNAIYRKKPYEDFFLTNIAEWRLSLGRRLGKQMSDDIKSKIDFISPVPNTGLYYAMGVSEETKIPYLQCLEKLNADIRSFRVLNTDKRKSLLWDGIRPVKELINGKCIGLVDEAIFTGTTLKVVCQMVRECGAEKVFLLIPTPVCKTECNYYVMPRRKMLLEYINRKALEQYFDIDGIAFLTLDAFEDSLKPFGTTICMECFERGSECSE